MNIRLKSDNDFIQPFIFDWLSEKQKKKGFEFLQQEYCHLKMTVNDLNAEIKKLKDEIESEKIMNDILTKENETLSTPR